MELIIQVMSGPDANKQIMVEPGQTRRVGRSRSADVTLLDRYLSGTHFAIECDAEGCRIRDMKSQNGTKVNGVAVDETVLHDGDLIAAGESVFVVSFKGAANDDTATVRDAMSKTAPALDQDPESRTAPTLDMTTRDDATVGDATVRDISTQTTPSIGKTIREPDRKE